MFGKSKKEPEQLDFDALLNKKRNLDLEILGRHDKEIESLKVKVTTVADALGVSVAELFGIKTEGEGRRKKRSARMKYRDPQNVENTWTGKGRPPKWMQEKLDQGAAKDEFLIQ